MAINIIHKGMELKIKHILLSLAISLGLSTTASAAIVTSDLTAADYITVNGLDWAWASPITTQFFGSNELHEADFHAGWREATDAEWAVRPDSTAFGSTCASQYWNTVYTHCDFSDSLSQHWQAGSTGDSSDLWYVRDVASSSVPEPATMALLGFGLFGIASMRRRKK